jgi:hypothetical protein
MILVFLPLILMGLVALIGMFGGRGITMPTISLPASSSLGVGKAAAGIRGLTLVDSIHRHNVVASVDTWTGLTYQKGVASGNIKVPIDAGYLSKIEIVASADLSNTITNGLYCTSAIRLNGNGLKVGGIHKYPGPAFTSGGKTSGGAGCRAKTVTYATKIPVKGGNEISIDAIMCGSDVGDLSVGVVLTFTVNGRDYGIEDCDIREADLITKDADTVLTTLGADTLGNIVIPAGYDNVAGVIAVCAAGVGADYVATTRVMVVCSLQGNGLAEGGFYSWFPETGQVGATTTGEYEYASEPEIDPLDVPAKPGNVIELHACMIEEDPGLVNVMMGLLYSSSGMI